MACIHAKHVPSHQSERSRSLFLALLCEIWSLPLLEVDGRWLHSYSFLFSYPIAAALNLTHFSALLLCIMHALNDRPLQEIVPRWRCAFDRMLKSTNDLTNPWRNRPDVTLSTRQDVKGQDLSNQPLKKPSWSRLEQLTGCPNPFTNSSKKKQAQYSFRHYERKREFQTNKLAVHLCHHHHK